MTYLPARNSAARVHVVENEEYYWLLLERHSGPQHVFESQGDEHGPIDLRLAEAIEAVLVPRVGAWELSSV